jgi:hypothetical protein
MTTEPTILRIKHLCCGIIGLLLAACSMKSKQGRELKPWIENFQPTKDYLVGEWKLDSVVGKQLEQEHWAYFLKNGQFWQFNEYSEQYLMDSALAYQPNQIDKAGEPLYTITPLDSNFIALTDNENNQLIYERGRSDLDYEAHIRQFLQRNALKRKINGVWKVDSIRVDSTVNSNYIEADVNDYFNFSPNGTVYCLTGAHSADTLFSYDYRLFGDTINFEQNDMIMNHNLIRIDKRNLVFKESHGNRTFYLTKSQAK